MQAKKCTGYSVDVPFPFSVIFLGTIPKLSLSKETPKTPIQKSTHPVDCLPDGFTTALQSLDVVGSPRKLRYYRTSKIVGGDVDGET